MNALDERYDRLVSFESVHQAMKAEKILKSAAIDFLLVPTPRAISVSCGQCIFFSELQEKRIMELFTVQKIRYNKFFVRKACLGIYEEKTMASSP